MKALIKASIVVGVSLAVFGAAPALADGFKNCTKLDKASWKPASDAEAKAKVWAMRCAAPRSKARAMRSTA